MLYLLSPDMKHAGVSVHFTFVMNSVNTAGQMLIKAKIACLCPRLSRVFLLMANAHNMVWFGPSPWFQPTS